MRIAVMSDIRGNAEALRAVLRDLGRDPVSEIICLGDLVGYHAQPREVIATLRERGVTSVRGNHDLMSLGMMPPAGGRRTRRGAAWTGDTLNDEERTFLRDLPGMIQRPGGMLFVHSAPGEKEARLRTDEQFIRQREAVCRSHPGVRICFSADSAEPGVVEVPPSGRPVRHSPSGLVLRPQSFYFVNPGSVGEPRGPDDRASYAVYDAAHSVLSFHRAGYDRARVIRENYRRGLPMEPRRSSARRIGDRALAAARRLLGVPVIAG